MPGEKTVKAAVFRTVIGFADIIIVTANFIRKTISSFLLCFIKYLYCKPLPPLFRGGLRYFTHPI
jgi:hypothetical protein